MRKRTLEVKCSEIRKLVRCKKYEEAYEKMKTIDRLRELTITDYKAFFEVYSSMKMYDDAKQMLVKMFQRNQSKRVLYQIVCLCVRSGNLDEAQACYEDYIERAPNSEERFVLRYLIDKAKHVDYDIRIESLEELKKCNYYEEWAYELAKVYHKAGRKEDCIKECNDIILWFGEGVIVEKAKLLKRYYEEGDTSFIECVKMNMPIKEDNSLKKSFDVTVQKSNVEKELKDKILVVQNKMKQEKSSVEVSDVIQGSNAINKQEVNKKIVKPKQNVDHNCEDDLNDEIVNKKITDCIDNIGKKENNRIILLVTKHPGQNIEFVKRLAKVFEVEGIVKKSQVARIQGGSLNHVKLEDSEEKLKDSVLLIESASSIYVPAYQQLMDFSNRMNGRVVIIFEDTESKINLFRQEYYELDESRPYKIQL